MSSPAGNVKSRRPADLETLLFELKLWFIFIYPDSKLEDIDI